MGHKILIITVIILYGLISYIFIKNSAKEEDNDEHIKIIDAQLINKLASPEAGFYVVTIKYDNNIFPLYGKENYIIASHYDIKSQIKAKYDEKLSKVICLVNS